jgi:hypothetical protein
MEQAFDGVVRARTAIIRRHAPLYFSTYFFDYIGAVVNYAGAWKKETIYEMCIM